MTPEPPSLEPRSVERDDNQLHLVLSVLEGHWRLILGMTLLAAMSMVALEYNRNGNDLASTTETALDFGVHRIGYTEKASGGSGAPFLTISFDELLRRMDQLAIAELVLASLEERRGENGDSLATSALLDYSAKEISGAFSVDIQSEGTEFIRISARARTADASRLLVQEVSREVVKFHSTLLEYRIADEQHFFSQELDNLSQSLDVAGRAEVDFLKRFGYATDTEITQGLRDADRRLAQIYTTRSQLLIELSANKKQIEAEQAALPNSFSLIGDRVIQNLVVELQALLQQELTLSTVFQGAYPPLQLLQDEISEKEQTLRTAARQYNEGNPDGLVAWDHLKALRQRDIQIVSELGALDAEELVIQQRTQTLSADLPEVMKSTQEHARLTFEIGQLRQKYRYALESEFELRSAVRNNTGRLAQLGLPQSTVYYPDPPHYFNSLFIGSVIGFLSALGLALLIEMADTSIKSERDAVTYLKRPVIGIVPNMDAASRRKPKKSRRSKDDEPLPAGIENVSPSVVTLLEPRSPFSEAYRTIRTNLLFATIEKRPKTFMITSAVPAEGKTTTSVNLAIALAQNGSRVLLLDADMRRPHIHSVLGLERSPGLSDVLAAGMDVHQVMQTTPVPNLLVVPSGSLPPNPSELIGSERTKRLVSTLGDEFDVVICDVPSVVVVTDAVLMAQHVDSVLMVVAAHNARRHTIERALNLLETSKCDLVGLVLNGLKPTRRKHYYYYYYYDDASRRQRKRWYNE